MSSWKPATYNSVSPYLICDDPAALIAFLEKAFDGVDLRRFHRPDGSIMHAEVRIDDSVVMVGGGAAGWSGGEPHIHLYVADADATYARAIAAGAVSVQVPERKPDDDKRGGIRDRWGNTWWMGEQ